MLFQVIHWRLKRHVAPWVPMSPRWVGKGAPVLALTSQPNPHRQLVFCCAGPRAGPGLAPTQGAPAPPTARIAARVEVLAQLLVRSPRAGGSGREPRRARGERCHRRLERECIALVLHLRILLVSLPRSRQSGRRQGGCSLGWSAAPARQAPYGRGGLLRRHGRHPSPSAGWREREGLWLVV